MQPMNSTQKKKLSKVNKEKLMTPPQVQAEKEDMKQREAKKKKLLPTKR